MKHTHTWKRYWERLPDDTEWNGNWLDREPEIVCSICGLYKDSDKTSEPSDLVMLAVQEDPD